MDSDVETDRSDRAAPQPVSGTPAATGTQRCWPEPVGVDPFRVSIDEIAHGVVQILRALVFHTDLRWHGIRCRRPRAGCPSAIHHLMARSPSPKGWISLLMADVEHVFFSDCNCSGRLRRYPRQPDHHHHRQGENRFSPMVILIRCSAGIWFDTAVEKLCKTFRSCVDCVGFKAPDQCRPTRLAIVLPPSAPPFHGPSCPLRSRLGSTRNGCAMLRTGRAALWTLEECRRHR